MKKIKILFILFIGAALTIASCKKDPSGGDTPVVKKHSFVTKKTNDDGTYSKYTYNGDNQISKSEDYNASGTSTKYSVLTYSSKHLVKYESFENGTLKTKLEISNNSSGNPISADIYITQASGLAKIGSFNYTYSGDKLASRTMMYEINGQTFEVSKVEYTYTGDNITKETEYSLGASQALEVSGYTKYEYDSKKNPFLTLGLGIFTGDVGSISANNYTKETVMDASSTIDNAHSKNYTYEYNDKDYPIKETSKTFNNSVTKVTTYSYDYR